MKRSIAPFALCFVLALLVAAPVSVGADKPPKQLWDEYPLDATPTPGAQAPEPTPAPSAQPQPQPQPAAPADDGGGIATPALIALLVGAAGLGGVAVFTAGRRMRGHDDESAAEPVARTGRFARRDGEVVTAAAVATTNGHATDASPRKPHPVSREKAARRAKRAKPVTDRPRPRRAAEEPAVETPRSRRRAADEEPPAEKPRSRRHAADEEPPAEKPRSRRRDADEEPPAEKPRSRRRATDDPPATNGAVSHDALPDDVPPIAESPRDELSAHDEAEAPEARPVERADTTPAADAPLGEDAVAADTPIADAPPDDAAHDAPAPARENGAADAAAREDRRASRRRKRETRPAEEPGAAEPAAEDVAPEPTHGDDPPTARRRRGAWMRPPEDKPAPREIAAERIAPAPRRRVPPPAEPVAEDDGVYPACRIKLHNRPIRTHFYAVPYEGGPVLARSPYFKLQRGDDDGGPTAPEALRALVEELHKLGWQQTGVGSAPWDLRFQRGVRVAQRPG